MPGPEFQTWLEFYKQNPFDDYHRHYRPAALIATSLSGEPVDELINWLDRKTPKHTGADLATMKALGMKPPMRN